MSVIGSGSCFGDLGVLNGVRPNVICEPARVLSATSAPRRRKQRKHGGKRDKWARKQPSDECASMLAQQVPRSHTLITVTACQFLVINAFNFVRTVDPTLLGKLEAGSDSLRT